MLVWSGDRRTCTTCLAADGRTLCSGPSPLIPRGSWRHRASRCYAVTSRGGDRYVHETRKGTYPARRGKQSEKIGKLKTKSVYTYLGRTYKVPLRILEKIQRHASGSPYIYLLKQGKLCIKTPGIKEQRYGRVYSQTHDGDTYQRLGSMPTIPCRKKIDFFGAWLPYKKRGAIKIPNLSHDLLSSMSMRWMFEPLQMKTSDEWQIFHSQLFSRFLKIREMC